jgi:hypothetical protein
MQTGIHRYVTLTFADKEKAFADKAKESIQYGQ